MTTQNMKTLHLLKSIGRSSLRRDIPRVQPIWIIRGFVLIAVALACFALLLVPKAFAVNPAPDGGYPGSNTAEGTSALFSLTSGSSNTALGYQALYHDATGNYNTAAGFRALFGNTSGAQNTATGYNALSTNTTGHYNTANGVNALLANTIGSNNTASGLRALFGNTAGSENTAVGVSALATNDTGNQNTAVGFKALLNNRGGNNNIALGYQAGSNVGGMFNPRNNNIDIGNAGDFFDNNTIRIGDVQTAAFIAGIYNVNEGGIVLPVYINSEGQLGTQAPSSSRRFKKEIKPMDKISEAILSLKPVTFQYKSDKKNTPQFGLIAEEVAEANPDLVVRDEKGEIYTVRYDAVNAMLLNEFLKEHKASLEEQRKVQEQQATITQLKSTAAQQQKDFQATIAQLTRRLDEQASQIQKVSAQLEVNRPAPQMISNNR
jgi:hypothetical protein